MTDPEIDGTGSGFGKYQGKTLTEIREMFDKCAEEPNMRAISAILRITREQLDARGQLGIYPVFTGISGALTSLGLVGMKLLPDQYERWSVTLAIGAGCVTTLLALSLVSMRTSRRVNLKQEEAIRKLAVSALVKVLESRPALKPLSFEQEFTVKILLRKTAGSEPLRILLQTA